MRGEIDKLEEQARGIRAASAASTVIEHRRELHRQYDFVQVEIQKIKDARKEPSRVPALFAKIKRLPLHEQLSILSALIESLPDPLPKPPSP